VIFDPFSPAAIEDPCPQYAWFRQHDPVHRSEKLRGWLVFRHDDASGVLRDDERFSSDRSTAGGFRGPGDEPIRTVTSDPPEHTPVRAIVTATLNGVVRGMAPRIAALVTEAIERLAAAGAGGGDVDLVAEFAYPLPIRVIADLLGVPADERPRFQEWSRAVARGMDRFYSGDEAGRGLREIGAYFWGLVEERRGSEGDDLVHRLLAADWHGERLSDLEVVALCTALVFGGHETTVNLIASAVLALLHRPAELERLRARPELVDSAVEEFLRFDAPAQLVSRRARTDLVLRGRRIVTGDTVLVALGAANHDPERFADPARLDLARDPNPHLTFGLGTHFCPGAQLTRLEARAAIPALLRRFPDLRLGASPPVRRPTAVLRGIESLPVRLA
jgi:cytochrome P450